MSSKTTLHANPFYVLGVTTRDDRHKIVEVAEERALHLDHDTCQKARSNLTNPMARLSAEMAWMPGVAPRIAEKFVKALAENPYSVLSEGGLPELARANLMAAAFERITEDESAESIAEFIRDFAWVVELIDANDVLRDVNEDRSISGFPEVKGVETIIEELNERRKAYRSTLRRLLDSMDPDKLVQTMTDAVSGVTDEGKRQGPALMDELTDAYELETQSFLQKETENIAKLVESARIAAPKGEQSLIPILDKLEKVARNWDRVAQPIQLSAKSRGIQHQPSHEIAYDLRSLGVDLNNEHDMLNESHRMIELVRELFSELPEVAERLGEDTQAIAGLRHQAQEQETNKIEWARAITFRAEVGLVFKDDLSISPEGLKWKGSTYPLESITGVRWGAIRNSINGIPTGTDYTISYANNRGSQVTQLKNEATYSGFLEALWRGVCVRLIYDMVEALKAGRTLEFGDIKVTDDSVTLTKHKFLVANEEIRLGWHDVEVWSANGSFVIGHKADKKTYTSASYIENWNTHILEHVVRGGFKKGVRKLSDYIND